MLLFVKLFYAHIVHPSIKDFIAAVFVATWFFSDIGLLVACANSRLSSVAPRCLGLFASVSSLAGMNDERRLFCKLSVASDEERALFAG